jgi:tetratricopeptide (TPR) repeat protein
MWLIFFLNLVVLADQEQTFWDQGLKAFNEKEFKSAIYSFEKITNNSPTSIYFFLAKSHLAKIFFEQKEWEKTEKTLNPLLNQTHQPSHRFFILNLLAKAQNAQGKTSEAQISLTEAQGLISQISSNHVNRLQIMDFFRQQMRLHVYLKNFVAAQQSLIQEIQFHKPNIAEENQHISHSQTEFTLLKCLFSSTPFESAIQKTKQITTCLKDNLMRFEWPQKAQETSDFQDLCHLFHQTADQLLSLLQSIQLSQKKDFKSYYCKNVFSDLDLIDHFFRRPQASISSEHFLKNLSEKTKKLIELERCDY